MFEGMGTPIAAVALVGLLACGGSQSTGPAVGLVAGRGDTVIINSHYPTALPVHALDAKGRIITNAPIRFEQDNATDLPVTSAGAVRCDRSGDHRVHAVANGLSTSVFVLCRLVEYVAVPGPIQFVIGDPALSKPRPVTIGAYGADRRPVSQFVANIMLPDSDVVVLRGDTLYPRSRGVSLVGVHIGDRDGQTGVHIYQRVDAMDALDTLLRVHPSYREFAVPIRLQSGEQLRQRLPPGGWMLALLLNDDHEGNPIRLSVDGGSCETNLLNEPGRLGCQAGSNTNVIVQRDVSRDATAAATGYLLVRGFFGKESGQFVPRVPATSGSIACAKRLLSERGYAVQDVSDTQSLLRVARRDARLGTEARREWIEVLIDSDTTMRGRTWAVDSYPVSPPNNSTSLVLAPAEGTVADAREALEQCGRSS